MHESLDRGHLELLVALDETGRLRAAAERLHLSPSAASHRLKEAERRLGVVLADPDGRSLRLTDAGRHVADVGAGMLASLRSAEETARWMSSADRPAVRIALDFYDTAPWFERLIASPELPCDVDFIRVGYGETGVAVQSRRADLGVVVAPSGVGGNEMLRTDELVAVVRAEHPAARRGRLEPGDISEATYLTSGDRPSHGFEHHEFFEPAGVRPGRLRKVESLSMILRLMRVFGGVTVQPLLAIRSAPLDGLTVVPLEGEAIEVSWSIVERPDLGDNGRAMVEALRHLVTEPPEVDMRHGPSTPPAWAGR